MARRSLNEYAVPSHAYVHRPPPHQKPTPKLIPRRRPCPGVKANHVADLSTGRVAPHLTVVPAPPLREAFERMRGTPPLLGWYPPRRRHVQREEFPDRPTMIGDPCRHGRRGLGPDMTQTRVRGAEVVDGTNEIHAMLQRQRATYQGPASARQRSEALT